MVRHHQARGVGRAARIVVGFALAGGALLLTAGHGEAAGPGWRAPRTNANEAAAPDADEALYESLTVVEPGSSSLAVRRAAVAELPLAQLPPAARAKAKQVLDEMGLFRRLPTLEFDVDREVYQYFLTHPDVAVSSWRAMEISRFHLKSVGPNTFHADAGDGSVGTVEVWQSQPTDVLIYCDGAFKSPLLAKPIVARSIMRLRMTFFETPDGQPKVRHTGDVFVEFPSQTVETVARVISPVSHMIADKNFKQLSLYVNLMSVAMWRQPAWVETMARRMDVDETQREELLGIAKRARVSSEARTRKSLEPMQVDAILAPLREQAATPPAVAAQPETRTSIR